jgi:osmotically inducible lipoprotein OsmB
MEDTMLINEKIVFTAMTICTVLALGACGETKGERALSGGAIGAGAGAVAGGLAGGSALTGAVIGGAAGAATGALTDEDDIDLDD